MKGKLAVLGLTAALVMPVVSAGQAMAWGPQRPTYTNDNPADHAVFNSITDNPVLGDERDFVRIVEFRENATANKNTYTNNIVLEPGKRYEVFIYYHNNASATFNDKAHNYVGVARNAKVVSNFPHELAAGETKQISGIITSSTTNPESVWDEVNVTAKQAVTLHYVAASARLHNDWQANGTLLSTHMFEEGNLLGVNELDGLVLGCYEYSGYITYTLQVEAVESTTDPDPDPEPDPDPTPDPDPDPEPTPEPKPEVPEELPTTGPAEVVLAVVVILAIVAGGFYWYKTHNAVKKVTRRAKGKK